MTPIQERGKMKHASYDTWSTREQLCLASSVLKSGDQNWMSVSRSLKPFVEKEALRPGDWFSQKSCALQYAHLLENVDTPKRKKRDSAETVGESIVKKLTQERIAELGQILAFQRDEYQQLKSEVNLVRSGNITDEKLQKMWLAIEQEEREQEQKAKAHSMWLAKRQQKQENQTLTVGNQHKSMESMLDESGESTTEDEEKKPRGGRSPLLTSLLKSPSPTTQIQNSTTAQVTSPTIASLLVSSPKVPNSQLTTNIPPQLHQLVSTAITNTSSERPSAGAPTLSMLLEMPTNTQRGPLPNLTTTSIPITSTIPPEIHVQTPVDPISIENKPTPISSMNIPVTESMVQIIDHIDDVIRKDIMADVIDKDEINEIIGDIEELIKEEITGSPQINPPVKTEIIKNLEENPPQEIQVPVIERPESRGMDETNSLSESPQSEMAMEEIDSSTSNIAEIIGTVAIESTEPKIIVTEVPDPVQNVEKEKSEAIETKSSETDDSSIKKDDETNNCGIEKEKDEIIKKAELNSENMETEDKDTPNVETRSSETTKENTETVDNDKEDSTVKETEKNTDEPENKPATELDQIEMHLAKITGDPQEASSAEVASVSSEVTNDVQSTEDTEKSQDISLILEDDESNQGSIKKKLIDETNTENTLDNTESVELSKEETMKKSEIQETTTKTEKESNEETIGTYNEEIKKEDFKEVCEDTVSLHDMETKEDELEEGTINDESSVMTPLQEIGDDKKDNEDIKSEVENSNDKQENSMAEETKEDDVKPIKIECPVDEVKKDISKNEKDETKATEVEPKKEEEESLEMDEEESSLNKLSANRGIMKTYSKKQNVTIDSEPENEATGEGADYRAWKKAVMLVYNRLATHKYASVFLRPITEEQAPGYHSVIFRPMDLSTIKKNIDNGTIRSTMHFQRDVMLMFQNAIMYNKSDTIIYKMAVSMQEECLQHMQILFQVTGDGTFRRETRTAASSSSELSDVNLKRKRSHITPSPHDTDSPRSKKRRKSEND